MAGDIVEQLKDTRYPGQMEMRLQAAEIIEQYRSDHQSDEQTNNELRAQRDALIKALEEIVQVGGQDLSRGIAAEALRFHHVGSPKP